MTAICGFIRAGHRLDPVEACTHMARAQSAYGPHRQAVRGRGDVAFGRSLFELLPEDAQDDQPLLGEGGRYLLVADLRLDNRAELATALVLNGPETAALSDADLLLRAYSRWGDAVVDRLVGDFAFALWDAHDQRLTLARDPLGQRPLCYHHGADHFAFASMPRGILATGTVAPAADPQRIAEYIGDLVYPHDRSFYDRISLVAPGERLILARGRVHRSRYWNPAPAELRLKSFGDYVEAYRHHLDGAVRSKLRGADGVVGAHLSAGYDSSAVAATAARLLAPQSGRVTAFTAAPRDGFAGPSPRGRIADESGIAAITAALHPNMDHVVLRSRQSDPFSLLKQSIPLAQQPLGHVCNNVWWSAVNRAASERGLRVMLTGQMGNLSISAGSLFQLADLIRTGRWWRWSREAQAVLRTGDVNWRGVLANSLGPWLPRPAWRLISHAFLKSSLKEAKPSLLTSEWAARMIGAMRRSGREIRPPRDSFAHRLRLLQRQDSGHSRKMALALWGVDERDPTTDRRLVEFCLSLPLDMLLKDGIRRPLARAALADRLPREVLESRLRGYQMADWYEHISASGAADSLEEVRDCSAVRAVIDVDRVAAMIADWPQSGWERPSVVSDYRMDLMHALSAAHFIRNAGDGRPAYQSATRPVVDSADCPAVS